MTVVPSLPLDLAAVLAAFHLTGQPLAALPHGTGLIHRSWRVPLSAGPPLLLQQINTAVFHRPGALMQNLARVSAHIAATQAHLTQPHRRSLTLVPTLSGAPWFHAPGGTAWRAFHFIEDAVTVERDPTPDQAFQAAFAFGRFQHLLADLPGPRLHETIPHFHDTPRRLRALEDAVTADPRHRAALAAPEIAFLLARSPLATVLLSAGLPERITHNDTKLNNILFDRHTGQALCVVDLDTVMPGLSLYDFGDLVRTATSPTAEDEPDLSRIAVAPPLFAALARGYLTATRDLLTPAERALLLEAGMLITFEQALRFLTDFLLGDPYYPTTHPTHNLTRTRTQLRLLQSLEEQGSTLRRLLTTL